MRRALPAAVLLACALIGPASAQQGSQEHAATEVARSGDAVLYVGDDADTSEHLCLRLSVAQGNSSSCGYGPEVPEQIATIELGRGAAGEGPGWVGGATHPSVARVEVEMTDGNRVATDTVTNDAYKGTRAGRIRFFLRDVPGVPDVVRGYAADGRLVGIGDASGHSGRTIRSDEVLSSPGLTVRVELQSVIEPSPLQLDRRSQHLCIRVTEDSGSSSTCAGRTDPSSPLMLESTEGCHPRRSVLHGLVAKEGASLSLLLGSGRRITLPVHQLPQGYDFPLAAVASPLPRGEAVRSVALLDASGNRIAAQKAGLAPGGLRCASGRHSGSVSLGYAPVDLGSPSQDGAHAAVEAGGHRLMVADRGDQLCNGFDELVLCELAPVLPPFGIALQQAGMVWAVLSRHVMAVDLVGTDGTTARHSTSEGPGYKGQYAGKVRFLLVSAPGRYKRVRLLDAEGRDLGGAGVLNVDPRPAQKMRQVVSGRGWAITAGVYARNFGATGELVSQSSCLGIRLRGKDVPAPWGDCRVLVSRFDPRIAGEVLCSPRTAILFGALPEGTRGVEFRTSSGRRITGRVGRLPRSLGGHRVWGAAVPRSARLVSVKFRGGKRAPFTMMPPSKQCGYYVYPQEL